MYNNDKNTSTLLMVILVAAAVVIWYLFYKLTFRALSYNDAMDYASIARNISRGEGFISSYITPLGLSHKGLPHPDLWRAPAWPLTLAIFIKVFGATDQAVAFAAGFFYVAAAPLIFILAEYWFDRTVAFTSVLVYIFSAQNLYYSTSGLTESMALFLLVLLVCLLSLPRFKSIFGDLLLGFVTGVFYLARYNLLLFIPVIVLFRWHSRKPAASKAVGCFAVAFILTVLPWMWRNYILMGNPLFSLQKYEPVMFTRTYPGYSLYTMFENVNVLEFISSHGAEMWGKIIENAQAFRTGLFDPTFTGVSVILFSGFIIALFLPFNKRQKGVRPFLAGCFVLQLLALLVIHFIPRLFFMFMPFYIIYGLAAFLYCFRRVIPNKGLITVLVMALTVVLVYNNSVDWRGTEVQKTLLNGYAGSIREVMNQTKRTDLLISNDGHLLAWYGDRNAAKLPYSIEMLKELEKIAPVKAIYLSGRMSWNIPDVSDSWRKVFWGKPRYFYDFQLARRFEDGSLLYLKK